jgi:hypothetical protein
MHVISIDRIAANIEAIIGSGGFFDNLSTILSRNLQPKDILIEQSYQTRPSWELLPNAYNA